MFQRLKQRLNTLTRHLPYGQKGQSLVEMMIFTPLLIFLLLGVFEVGAALRNHLTLTNVNREITRFAIRPGYLDFSTKASTAASYNQVKEWASSSVGEQLDLDFDSPDARSSLIVSHLVVDTGLPCAEVKVKGNGKKEFTLDAQCAKVSSCDVFLDPDYENVFTLDDIIIHPGKPGHEFQAQLFGPAETVTGVRSTRLDYEDLAEELARQNNKFNCEVIKKNGSTSANNVIVTELFHDEPQFFGFPFISNPFTDPVPLYTHTTMRLIGAARSTGSATGNITDGIDTIGPVCFAFPTTVRRSVIQAAVPNQRIDILDGHGPSDFGWLAWNPGEDDENYLNLSWTYIQTSMNDYTDPTEWGDHTLNIGDYVTSLGGVVNSDDTRDILAGYLGKKLIIPVWDNLSPDGYRTGIPNPNAPPPTVEAYKVWDFVVVQIGSVDDIDIPQKTIMATYLGGADICE